ncbi:hypothetical protein [Rhodoligotrophos ferricapiens]|uniref:hypothetical protein n=1 Tax=Rhodoligotrophos ferricapiens TaxID=3069264 RepID=UPI00315DF15E
MLSECQRNATGVAINRGLIRVLLASIVLILVAGFGYAPASACSDKVVRDELHQEISVVDVELGQSETALSAPERGTFVIALTPNFKAAGSSGCCGGNQHRGAGCFGMSCGSLSATIAAAWAPAVTTARPSRLLPASSSDPTLSAPGVIFHPPRSAA